MPPPGRPGRARRTPAGLHELHGVRSGVPALPAAARMAAARRPCEPRRGERNQDHTLGHGAQPGEGPLNLTVLLRLTGASIVLLSLLHAVFWRALNWDREVARLSPLNARVFAVQTFFIAFVLMGLGLLSLARPELFLARSELARVLLCGVVAFWVARLLLQPLVFDRVMRDGWTRSPAVRLGASLLWLAYVLVYAAALYRQVGND